MYHPPNDLRFFERAAPSLPKRRAVPAARGSFRILAALLLVMAACGLSGCTHMRGWLRNGFKVGPNYHKPAVPVAENWIDFNDRRELADPAQDRNWWQVFGDPTLDQLVQSSYAGNLPLRVAGLRVLEARAQRAVAVGNLFPQQQSASGFYRHIQLSRAGNSVGVAPTSRAFDLWNIGAGLNWELDVWGRFRRQIESADATLDARVEDYDDVLVLLLAETARAYTDLRTAQARVRLARENVRIQQGNLQLAEARFREGAVSKLDVTQARSTLRETESLIPQFQAQSRRANNQLCILLGIPPRDLTPELGEAPIPVAPTTVAVGIPADLIRRRPDVRSAERQVAAQSALIGVATADLFPEFTIDGSFNWTASQFPDLFTPAAFGGSIGPSFRWRILNYGRLVNNIRVQEARFQQLAVQYQNTVLEANAEVENALVTFFKAQQRANRLEEATRETEESVRLATTQYREGAVDFERVFNLQNVLVRQQDNLALARGEIALALIDVYRAIGGGWQLRLERPPVLPVLLPPVEEVSRPEGEPGRRSDEDAEPPQQPADSAPRPLPPPDGDEPREPALDSAAAVATPALKTAGGENGPPLQWRKTRR